MGEGPSEKVRWGRSVGEDPQEKGRQRRFAREGPPEKIRWRRSVGEGPREKGR